MVHLNNIWFVIVAIFWVGFFVLEGFDFGVGMLHSFVGRNDVERRIAVNSIGPIWDGNEVWLIVAGAAIFAAFPSLVRHHVLHLLPGPGGRAGGPDRARRLLRVPPQDRQPPVAVDLAVVAHHRQRCSSRCCSAPHWATSSTGCPSTRPTTTPAASVGLLVPFGLYTGVTLTVLSLFLGAAYLTPQDRRRAARPGAPRLSGRLGWLAAVVTFGWLTWSHVGLGRGLRPQPDRRPGPGRGGRRGLARRVPLRGLGLRRRRHRHRQRRRARSSSSSSPG